MCFDRSYRIQCIVLGILEHVYIHSFYHGEVFREETLESSAQVIDSIPDKIVFCLSSS